MDIRFSCFLLCLIVIATPAFSGDIKRWIDENGQVHFGNFPPHGADATVETPKIITTKPGTNNSLEDVLRPGEIDMINRYEMRGKRLLRAKKRSARRDKKKKKVSSKMIEKCLDHKQKKSDLERKLRKGYKGSKRPSIKAGIARHSKLIRHYCR